MPCEISLFDIRDKFLIAKSKHKFVQSESNSNSDISDTDNLLIGLLELFFWVLDAGSTYPVIDHLDADILESYFYYFLKHIHYTDKIDYGYLFLKSNSQ